MAGIWETDVYRYYTEPSYARPRKIVDNLKLDWLDLRERYYSPEVEFFTKEEILKRSGWSEDEVRILYYEAVEIIDRIFYILNMNDTGKVVAVAAAGASEDNCKAFLDKYYDRIDVLGEFESLRPGLVADWL